MPTIDIVEGHGRSSSEFLYKSTPGEKAYDLKTENLNTDLASAFVKDARRAPSGFNQKGDLKRATESLVTFMPREAAEKMVDALLQNEVGSRVVLVRGESGTIYDVKEIVISSSNG